MKNPSFLVASSVFLLSTLICVGCVYDPVYEGMQCGAEATCPDNYSCDPLTHTCKSDDDRPDASTDGRDDAGQDDAGQDDAGQVDGGGDGAADGADLALDGGGDDSADGGDIQPADEGPCPGGCPDGEYCDTDSSTCIACQDSEHCGHSCTPCAAEVPCIDLGGMFGYCCRGDCDFEHVCNQAHCDNDATYICKATSFSEPHTHEWVVLNQDPSLIFCPLANVDGVLPEMRCLEDEETLIYNCPWHGKCQTETNACEVDMSIVESHVDCGPDFGCIDGRCRKHLKTGLACSFNYDCESFCCSRESSATCQPPGTDSSQCKMKQSLYWTTYLIDLSTFTADSHDMSTWTSSGGDSTPSCDHDYECDSGSCYYFLRFLESRCLFNDCVGTDGGDKTRESYFCSVGDSADHQEKVTNGRTEPNPGEGDCDY